MGEGVLFSYFSWCFNLIFILLILIFLFIYCSYNLLGRVSQEERHLCIGTRHRATGYTAFFS